jgi:hypothetical protein
MKPPLLFALLLVGGCTQMITQDPTPVTIQLALSQNGGALYIANPGNEPIGDAILGVRGQDLRVNDNNCAPVMGGIDCKLGAIPNGRRYVLPFGGTVQSATMRYVRAGQNHVVTAVW